MKALFFIIHFLCMGQAHAINCAYESMQKAGKELDSLSVGTEGLPPLPLLPGDQDHVYLRGYRIEMGTKIQGPHGPEVIRKWLIAKGKLRLELLSGDFMDEGQILPMLPAGLGRFDPAFEHVPLPDGIITGWYIIDEVDALDGVGGAYRLKILSSHGPDLKVIQARKKFFSRIGIHYDEASRILVIPDQERMEALLKKLYQEEGIEEGITTFKSQGGEALDDVYSANLEGPFKFPLSDSGYPLFHDAIEHAPGFILGSPFYRIARTRLGYLRKLKTTAENYMAQFVGKKLTASMAKKRDQAQNLLNHLHDEIKSQLNMFETTSTKLGDIITNGGPLDASNPGLGQTLMSIAGTSAKDTRDTLFAPRGKSAHDFSTGQMLQHSTPKELLWALEEVPAEDLKIQENRLMPLLEEHAKKLGF